MATRVSSSGDETFRCQVQHPQVVVGAFNLVADGVHQVRLAKPDAAVKQQRVERPARVRRHLLRGGAREPVRLALDESLEGLLRVQARLNARLGGLRQSPMPLFWRCFLNIRRRLLGAGLQLHVHRVLFQRQDSADVSQTIFPYPFAGGRIRRDQSQTVFGLNRFQRSYPCVDVFLREQRLQLCNALLPQTHRINYGGCWFAGGRRIPRGKITPNRGSYPP